MASCAERPSIQRFLDADMRSSGGRVVRSGTVILGTFVPFTTSAAGALLFLVTVMECDAAVGASVPATSEFVLDVVPSGLVVCCSWDNSAALVCTDFPLVRLIPAFLLLRFIALLFPNSWACPGVLCWIVPFAVLLYHSSFVPPFLPVYSDYLGADNSWNQGFKMAQQKRSKSVSAEECREFLLAAVNDRPGFVNGYKGWLPQLCREEHDLLMHLYQRLRPLWQHSEVPLAPAPDDVNELFVLLLRHKLRVVWERALGPRNTAAPAAARLWAETREVAHERQHLAKRLNLPRPDTWLWLGKAEVALLWLQHNTPKLIKCANPSCTKHRYFVRAFRASNQKYCSESCSSSIERARVNRRPARQPKNASRLSAEGRERIAASQRQRWEKYRQTSGWMRRPL